MSCSLYPTHGPCVTQSIVQYYWTESWAQDKGTVGTNQNLKESTLEQGGRSEHKRNEGRKAKSSFLGGWGRSRMRVIGGGGRKGGNGRGRREV
jgi:hypothetical protein